MAGLKRIIWHWTAGAAYPTANDLSHYHYLIDRHGQVHSGKYPPEANISTSDADGYAAHTLKCNTGSIGVGLCGMIGAVERPFSPGRAPICDLQIDVLVELTARLCRDYKIKVSRETVLSHAEVQPVLGIAQRGKWDIAWLPGDLKARDPIEIGDYLRGLVSKDLSEIQK